MSLRNIHLSLSSPETLLTRRSPLLSPLLVSPSSEPLSPHRPPRLCPRRLLISSLGQGKRISLSAIMLQISSGIALLWLAGAAADFLMLYILPEAKHYRTYKQERTPDFSDLRNKIAEVEGEKKKLRDRKNRFAAKLDES